MRKLIAAAVALALLSVLVMLGQASGNQPPLDATAAAREELGVAFYEQFVDVGEVTLHVVFAGPNDGPPVLLLHGFPEFWYAWRGAAAVLARAGFRVILPDQRGYNLSDKPDELAAYRLDHLVGDVIGLIDALGYERVKLGAQDWGGAVAWRTVIEHPDRIEQFAVIDAPHPLAMGTGSEETISWYRTFMKIPVLPGFTARLLNWRLLSTNMRETSAPGAFPEEVLKYYRSAWDRNGAMHKMVAWYRAEGLPVSGEARVATPTLVVLAAKDAFIPASRTRGSLAFLDNGELHELGSGTHWVSGEEPERIGALFGEFFSRTAP